MIKVEGFNEAQQSRFDGYFQRLEKFEKRALANELAMMFVLIPLIPIEKIMEQARENTRIIRNNRKIIARNKKAARLNTLCKKSRLNKGEQAEVLKLCGDLGI